MASFETLPASRSLEPGLLRDVAAPSRARPRARRARLRRRARAAGADGVAAGRAVRRAARRASSRLLDDRRRAPMRSPGCACAPASRRRRAAPSPTRAACSARSPANAGDRRARSELAVAAYLEGVEPHEASLRARDAAAVRRASRRRSSSCAAPSTPAPPSTPTPCAATWRARPCCSTAPRSTRATDKSVPFFAALAIALREGFEIALLISALLAFVRKSGHPESAPYVHVRLAAGAAGRRGDLVRRRCGARRGAARADRGRADAGGGGDAAVRQPLRARQARVAKVAQVPRAQDARRARRGRGRC